MSVEAEAPPASTMPSLKRPHPDNEVTMDPSTPMDTRETSPSPASTALSSPVNIATPKDTPMASTEDTATSDSPSKASNQSTLRSVTQPSTLSNPTPQSSSAPPAKRRKFTPAEKAQAEAEKAKKVQDRTEAAARKEAEKQAKEDAKRKKAEEKEAERVAKEEEKAAKDEERRKKAEERESEKALKEFKKQEKEREAKQREASQMRLSSFFAVPKVSSPAVPLSAGKLKASASPSKHNFITKDEARRRSMSLDPVDFEPSTPTKSKHVSDSDKQAKQAGKGFLPFMLGQNMRLAPHNAFLPAEKELVRINEKMDEYVGHSQSEPSPSVKESFATLKMARGYQPPKVAQVVQKLHRSSRTPIDLTQERGNSPADVLKTIPIKFFFYGEDVRPPYQGTWTRSVNSRTARTLALKPLSQALPEVVYDYDSEAEWDDADEGEDIDIEDNEEEEEEEEEMEGFIDDDNAPQYLARRGLPANEVEPICSGLQWEDAGGKMRSADPNYPDADFKEYEVCFLLDPSPSTIDPFTTVYWDPEPKQVTSMLPLTSSMGPPRLPLSDRTNGQGTVQATLVNGKVPKAAKVGPRLVPADVLPAFRDAVDGSDLTKIALIEALKKQFPKLRKDQITETLPLIAHRIGARQADKKWKLLAEAKV